MTLSRDERFDFQRSPSALFSYLPRAVFLPARFARLARRFMYDVSTALFEYASLLGARISHGRIEGDPEVHAMRFRI